MSGMTGMVGSIGGIWKVAAFGREFLMRLKGNLVNEKETAGKINF